MNNIIEFREKNYYLGNFYKRYRFGFSFKNNEIVSHAMKCPERASEFFELGTKTYKQNPSLLVSYSLSRETIGMIKNGVYATAKVKINSEKF